MPVIQPIADHTTFILSFTSKRNTVNEMQISKVLAKAVFSFRQLLKIMTSVSFQANP